MSGEEGERTSLFVHFEDAVHHISEESEQQHTHQQQKPSRHGQGMTLHTAAKRDQSPRVQTKACGLHTTPKDTPLPTPSLYLQYQAHGKRVSRRKMKGGKEDVTGRRRRRWSVAARLPLGAGAQGKEERREQSDEKRSGQMHGPEVASEAGARAQAESLPLQVLWDRNAAKKKSF